MLNCVAVAAWANDAHTTILGVLLFVVVCSAVCLFLVKLCAASTVGTITLALVYSSAFVMWVLVPAVALISKEGVDVLDSVLGYGVPTQYDAGDFCLGFLVCVAICAVVDVKGERGQHSNVTSRTVFSHILCANLALVLAFMCSSERVLDDVREGIAGIMNEDISFAVRLLITWVVYIVLLCAQIALLWNKQTAPVSTGLFFILSQHAGWSSIMTYCAASPVEANVVFGIQDAVYWILGAIIFTICIMYIKRTRPAYARYCNVVWYSVLVLLFVYTLVFFYVILGYDIAKEGMVVVRRGLGLGN
jgi:hypothetical protein